MWSLLLSAIVAASSLWLLELQKLGKHKKNKLQTSVSSLFLIKRHPIKYMHIEKNLTKKTLLFPSSDVKRAYDLLRGRSLASRICVTSLNNGRKKTPSLIRVAVNKNFNLHMYLWIALLLQNKLLIWRPLGYWGLSVPSYNMLFSLLTAADFLYHQFWEFDSWSRQSLPFHDNYVIFNTLLLGNLLKEVKRNNMLITLELKKTSASFQNLPTLICVLRLLNVPCTFLLGNCNTVKRK